MKKLGLVALLAALTLGVVACGNPQEPSSQPSEEQSSQVEQSSEEQSSEEEGGTEVAELPVAWGENATYAAAECNVSFIPGAISGNTHAKPVSDYLNHENVRFFDLRDVKEGYGVGHVQGFESVSYFNTIVGTTGQLFTKVGDEFVANYEESEAVINNIFPKDAALFVMCQVGGRVQPFCTLLDQLGYDMSKVYNVGGWNQLIATGVENYGGYKVSKGIAASEITYDFSSLTPVAAATRAARRAALPEAWGENATYAAAECNVSFIPGAISGNTHAKPVKDYFTTENIRFFDLRDVKEGYGVGHVQKFESVSYFNTIVGTTGQLFTKVGDEFVANYEESEAVINNIFPKDATLFVMCQVGGRVQPFLTLLDQLGYDMSKVYNVGGWNQLIATGVENYDGYKVSKGIAASAVTYDFSSLTPVAA